MQSLEKSTRQVLKRFLDPSQAPWANSQVSENQNGPQCPRCNPSRTLIPKALKGIAVLVCPDCEGLLVSRSDLDAWVATTGRSAPKKIDGAKYFERLRRSSQFKDSQRPITCPHCRYNMSEVQNGDLVIDFCLSCEAVWFDRNELKTALALAKRHGAIDIIPDQLDGNLAAALIGAMLDFTEIPSKPR